MKVSFLVLLAYILFNYFRLDEFIPLCAKIPHMKIIAGMLFLTFFLERGRLDFFTNLRQNRLLAIIIVFMFLSIPFAFHRSICLYGTLDFCKVAMIFVVFLNLVDNTRGLKLVMWTILISTTYAMYEIVNVYLLGQFGGRFEVSRTKSMDSNDLAGLLVTVIPLAVGLLRLNKSLIIKLLLMGSLATYLLGIVVTQSRGGFVGLLAIGAVYIFRAKRRMITLFLVGIVAVATYTIMPKASFERFKSIPINERGTGSSADLRIEAWKAGLRMAKDHPLFGVGVECFGKAMFEAYNVSFNPNLWYTAHNSFILILAEVGVPAFLCYLGIYYLNFKDTKIIRRRLSKETVDPEAKREILILSNAFEISLVGFATTAVFLSHTYGLTMYLITAFIIVLKRITERLAYDNQPQVGMDRISAIGVK